VNEKECDGGDAMKKKREISLYGEICVRERESGRKQEREIRIVLVNRRCA